VVTGGGPGIMEAVNLGAFCSRYDPGTLDAAIDELAAAPTFQQPEEYTGVALRINRALKRTDGELRYGGLAIPTWLYGHEPPNLFAAGIAKYFSNAIREDTLLRLARGGVVFAPGEAGTVQEIFQAVTKAFYAADGPSGPLVFLGSTFWTDEVPVRALLGPLLARSAHDLGNLVHVTDDVHEAVQRLT
jgi:predicted Rossmann-fold nucleotide-binding protein